MNYGFAILTERARLNRDLKIAVDALTIIAAPVCIQMGPERIDCWMLEGDDQCPACVARRAFTQINEDTENAATIDTSGF